MGFQFVDNLRACCYLVRVDEQFFFERWQNIFLAKMAQPPLR